MPVQELLLIGTLKVSTFGLLKTELDCKTQSLLVGRTSGFDQVEARALVV